MSLLTASDLTWMGAVQQQAMPGTVVIERYTFTPDGQGGGSESWTAVGTALMRIYPVTQPGRSEVVAGAQIISMTKWWATGPLGIDVTAKDRLSYNSRTWEVLSTNNSEMYQTAVRCELEAHNQERRT